MKKLSSSSHSLNHWSTISSSPLGNSSLQPGEGKIVSTHSMRPAQTASIFTLPVKVFTQIAQYMTHPQDRGSLRMTCLLFQRGIDGLQSQQWEKFDEEFFEEAITLLDKQLEGYEVEELKKIKVLLPAPNTPSWKDLKSKVGTDLTVEDQIRALCITIWDLLLQPTARAHKEHVLMLMAYAELISPFLANAEEYTAKLFPQGFPQQLFDWLVTIRVGFCLQIIVRYFPVKEDSPDYQFIKAQYSLITLEDIREIRNYPKTEYPSFLFLALKNSIQYDFINKLEYEAASRFLDQLLNEDCDLEQSNKNGDTALLYALKHERARDCADLCLLVSRLLKKGAEYNVQDDNGMSPLMVACQRTQEKVVTLLLGQPYIEVNIGDNFKKCALDYALQTQDLLIVAALLRHPGMDDNLFALALHKMAEQIQSNGMDQATQRAKEKGMEEAEKLLGQRKKIRQFIKTIVVPLVKEINAQKREESGIALPKPYSIEWETLKGKVEVDSAEDRIKAAYITLWDLLIQTPLLLNEEDQRTVMGILTQLRRMLFNPDDYMKALFNDEGGFPEALFDRLAKLHLDFCLQLIVWHFPLDEGSPALAFINARYKLISQNDRKLIDDVKYFPHVKHSSFLFLALHGYIEYRFNEDEAYKSAEPFLHELFTHGADLKGTNKDGDTPLFYVLGHPNVADNLDELYKLVIWLLKEGAACNGQNDKGMTPLMLACQQSREKIVKVLLTQPGLEVNAEDKSGNSALDYAIAQHNFPIFYALLQHPESKAGLAKSKNQWVSRLAYAIAKSDLQGVQQLLKSDNSDVNARIFAFNYALYCDKEEIINVFLQGEDLLRKG